MTQADFATFKTALDRTAMAYSKALPTDLAATYFGDLDTYPLQAVLAAIEKARREGKFFPRVATLRELCATHSQVLVTTDVPAFVNHDQGVYFCQDCADTGFVRGLLCDGDGRCHIGGCGKAGHTVYAHVFTRFCSCRGTNPVLLRQSELIAQRTAKVDAS
jgi:hypothetical protein